MYQLQVSSFHTHQRFEPIKDCKTQRAARAYLTRIYKSLDTDVVLSHEPNWLSIRVTDDPSTDFHAYDLRYRIMEIN